MPRGRPSKKQAILATAQTLFSEFGYQGTSIDLVVKESNSSKPTVYNNFPTKQALLHELLNQAIEDAEQQRCELAKRDDISLAAALLQAFELITHNAQHLAIYRICYGERHKLDEQSSQLFADYENALRQWCEAQLQARLPQTNQQQAFAIRAICREGLIIPALANEPAVSRTLLEQLITAIIESAQV